MVATLPFSAPTPFLLWSNRALAISPVSFATRGWAFACNIVLPMEQLFASPLSRIPLTGSTLASPDRGFLAGRDADTAFAGTAPNKASSSSSARLSADMFDAWLHSVCTTPRQYTHRTPSMVLWWCPPHCTVCRRSPPRLHIPPHLSLQLPVTVAVRQYSNSNSNTHCVELTARAVSVRLPRPPRLRQPALHDGDSSVSAPTFFRIHRFSLPNVALFSISPHRLNRQARQIDAIIEQTRDATAVCCCCVIMCSLSTF